MNDPVKSFIEAEFKKAESSLLAAEKLLELSLNDDAISRAYYAVFHGARAALKSKNIDTGTHKSLINQFALHFIKPGVLEMEYGDILRQEKEDRETGDYETFVSFSFEETEKRIKDAKRFISRVKEFLKRQGFLSHL